MDLNLEKKIILITGGAKGIGAAITKMRAQQGAFPVAVDRDAEVCERLDRDLKNKGLRTMFVPMDVSSAENCKEAVQQAHSEFERIDAQVIQRTLSISTIETAPPLTAL